MKLKLGRVLGIEILKALDLPEEQVYEVRVMCRSTHAATLEIHRFLTEEEADVIVQLVGRSKAGPSV